MRSPALLAPVAVVAFALPISAADPVSPLQIEAHRADVFSLAFSPNGKLLASACKDRTVGLWNPVTGEEVKKLKGHTADVLRVTFSPDGKSLASAGADGTIRIWDPNKDEPVRTIKAHSNWVAGIAYSPHGRWLASASA